jgi:hypothetical protein
MLVLAECHTVDIWHANNNFMLYQNTSFGRFNNRLVTFFPGKTEIMCIGLNVLM